MEAVTSAQNRLRALLDAVIALSSELSLDAVLQKIIEAAAELTGARYAALGVIDASGRALEQFVVTGMDADTQLAIGELPHGRGILGVLIDEGRPLRLDDLRRDPRAVGFPPGHPPMKSFLGVPILLRGDAYGNLYLTEKEGGGPFTEEDEELAAARVAGRSRRGERAPVRIGNALGPTDRVAEPGGGCSYFGDGAPEALGSRRRAPSRACRRQGRLDRAARGR